ncbi:hypothetical protein N7462_011677 [Penicillium macrosclerotiorum]|uniref:uncharacterized protein n=1 Tax=Penicillium macrosclerotiorum TaxID=303699 RepID=UPI0025498152|nr:uncharacterized protein N7462_011677 [Penicillium macrosclerotiorum]KAJ5662751.1 hypothetical protein N7462_011677 [Penicillium macrosclerotiorum]
MGSTAAHQPGEFGAHPIAIVGMSMRLPGGVRSAADFWQLLSEGRDGNCVTPDSRYNEEGFYSDSGAHSVRMRRGYYLEEDLETLDTSFFDMDGLQPSRMDPQQKMLLQVVWDCLENAGQVDWRGKPIGCFVGTYGGDWEEIEVRDAQNAHNFHMIGHGKFSLANVVSYELHFNGPSMTIETGCSSSMVALHQACQAVLLGDCSAAIVAGSNLILTPSVGIHGSGLGVFSPSGISKCFDASADGYGRGEAVNAVFIKRLDDALRDRDQIRAVIRSSMVNCNGRSPGITTPSAEAQEKLIRETYERASISDLSQTAFIECHGTGTLAGDPIECSAIAKTFSKEIYIGSVKANVGHSEGASGLTSLIKAVLSLENRLIPPNIHFHQPNPRIPWDNGRLRVPKSLTAWPKNRKERISVSNFGIGGSNAHVILDSFSSFMPTSFLEDGVKKSKPQLLVISAKSQEALLSREQSLLEYMSLYPDRLSDLTYTLGVRREHLSHRGFLINTNGITPEIAAIKYSVAGRAPNLTYIFTGQGAQWAGMGRGLMKSFKSFRDMIQSLNTVLQNLKRPPSWNLEVALAEFDGDQINEPQLSQTLCCALQIALVSLLGEWGIKPAAVIGHSSGEIAASYAAGAITAESAIVLSYYRGLLVDEEGSKGAMAAVSLGRVQVASYLQDSVVIACENSPNSVTLSGEPYRVEEVIKKIKSDFPDALCRTLRVNRSYHSGIDSLFMPEGDETKILQAKRKNLGSMTAVGKVYETSIRPYIKTQNTMIPMYSSVTGEIIMDPKELNSNYWVQNLVSPVLFWGAAESVMQDHAKLFFLEIGPHSALSGPLRDIHKSLGDVKQEMSYASCLIRGQCQETALLTAAGELFLSGIQLKFEAINGSGKLLTDFDPYPWKSGKVEWSEGRITREWRRRKHAHHQLLGSRAVESTQLEPSWRNMLSVDDVPCLWDHRIGGSTVFPCAGYIVMAGEAMRQVTGCHKYRLRNLRMSKALTLDDRGRVEVVSNFRPARPTDEPGSGWYEFSISSFRMGSWVKHCTGQVRSEASSPTPRDIRGLPRSVTSHSWYENLKERGLEYGPKFRLLQHISAHPTQLSATASLERDRSSDIVNAPDIDQCLQLVAVAMSNGLSRRCNTVGMPVYIQEVFVGKAGPDMFLEATAAGTTLGMTSGSAWGQSGAEVGIKIDGVEFMGFDEGSRGDGDQKLCSNLVWAPDVDLVPEGRLLMPSNQSMSTIDDAYAPKQQFFDMCIIETARLITDLEPASEHLRKYQHWMTMTSAQVLKNIHSKVLATDREFLQVPRGDWTKILAGLKWQIDETMPLSKHFAELSLVVLENCTDIVQGRCQPLGLLMENDGLSRLYNTGTSRNYEEFLRLLGHSQPDLQIIEIGAGTGATTARALQCLHREGKIRQYSRYVFTDISSAFFRPAMERFKKYEAVEYAVLDISQPPVDQGIEFASFDLVIASNVLHATCSIQETLKNVKSLLKPGGRVLIEEICSGELKKSGYNFANEDWADTIEEAQPIDFIMGVLPGWWIGEHDKRVNAPYISVDRWRSELQEAGFENFHSAPGEAEIYMTSILASIPPLSRSEGSSVSILCNSQRPQWAVQVAERIEALGFPVRWCTLSEPPPANEDVISFLDNEEPFLYSLTNTQLAQFQEYLSSCTSTRVLWVTRSSQMRCPDPRYGLTLGFARTMRTEYEMDFDTIELEEFDHISGIAVVEMYRKFQQQRFRENETVDHEFAIQDGVIHIPRYHSKKDDVEIDVKFVGLNFRDLMVSLGMLQGKSDIGLEGSGVVRRVGSDVAHVHEGDRVLFLASPAFSTRVVVSGALVVALPAELPLDQAATIGCAYTTAVYCLLNLGRLQKNMSVLIHSAAGGVGIASIMLCQMLGVQIFATVGNQEKAQYLIETFGIRKEHIFDSRSTSFAPNLLKRTRGQGVDLVLNSLAGDLLLASWECVAEGGMMVEIGKRDLMGHSMLPMDRFLANRSFMGVDILSLAKSRPQVVLECLKTISTLLAKKSIAPIQPIRRFAADQITDAFKHMQEGKHMGKIVVEMPNDTSSLPMTKTPAQISFCEDVAYLLVGGLGGLGRAVAQWMVENGARNLVFLSRTAGTRDKDVKFIYELELQGCHPLLIQGDVANLEDVKRAVAASGKPMKGVIHMAMLMKDSPFFSMTHDQWTEALRPKVEGVWNLHKALQSDKLDFFLMFSSVAAAAGSAGQANYTAANTFLNAFARYRQSLGLTASVLDVGWITDVGYVSQRPELLDMMRSKGFIPLREIHLLAAMQLLLAPPKLVDGAPSKFSEEYHLSIGLGLLWNQASGDVRCKDARYRHDPAVEVARLRPRSSETSNIKTFLHSVEKNPEILKLAPTVDFLNKEMALLMGPYSAAVKNEDWAAMAEISVDSLVAVEARAWLKRNLEVELGLVDIATAGTVGGVVTLTIAALSLKHAAKR